MVVVIGVLAGISFVMIQGVIDMARMARSKSFAMGIQRQLALNEVGVWQFDDDPVSPAVIGGVHDASGWGNHGELHVGTGDSHAVKWVPGVFGKALEFDGSDDFMNISLDGFPDPMTDITIEFWASPSGLFADNNLFFAVPEDFRNRLLLFFPWDNTIFWDFGDIVAGGSLATPWNTAWNNVWAHWVFISEKGVGQRMYRDTILIASDNTWTIFSPGTQTLHIADHGLVFWKGLIDEVRIYSRALTVFEIQQRYVKGIESLLARGMITDEDFNNRMVELENNLVVK